MYTYYINLSIARKNTIFDDHLVKSLELACISANNTESNKRFGRCFSIVNRINEYSILLKLRSSTSIVPTRAISSITRALIRVDPALDVEPYKYNGMIFAATLAEETEEGMEKYSNLEPYEIVQSVIEIFFGQAQRRNRDKDAARRAASSIKDIVAEYRASVDQ